MGPSSGRRRRGWRTACWAERWQKRRPHSGFFVESLARQIRLPPSPLFFVSTHSKAVKKDGFVSIDSNGVKVLQNEHLREAAGRAQIAGGCRRFSCKRAATPVQPARNKETV